MVMNVTHWTDKTLDRVMGIWLSGNKQAHPFVDPSYWERHWEEVREAVPQSQILAWTEEDDIVAFLGYSGDWIAGLFVDKERRGQGIGHELMEEAKREHSRLRLAVYVENRRAVSFYRREGFSMVEERKDNSTGQLEWEMEWRAK